MASKWLRGVVYDTSSTNYSTIFYRKIYALWLEKVLGFAFMSESVGGGRSWRSTEKNGTNGVFSGTNFEFVDATAASFASSDVDKFIVINDDAHYINAGVYRIVQYISSSKIVIDYAAGTDEYPISSTGLSWWIFGPNYQLPISSDSIILKSPHTDEWQIKLVAESTYNKTHVYIAPNGDWLTKQVPSATTYIGLGGYVYDRTIISYWAEGDVDGEWLHMWGMNCTYYVSYLTSIEHVTPVEGAHSSDELIFVKASKWPGSESSYIGRNSGGRIYDSNLGSLYTWSDKLNRPIQGYYIDYSYNGLANNYFESRPTWYGHENNSRRNNKREMLLGSYVCLDEQNADGGYEILGIANGHWSVPGIFDKAYGSTATYVQNGYGNRRSMVLLTKDSPGDLLYFNEDIAVPWCNLSIRAGGI